MINTNAVLKLDCIGTNSLFLSFYVIFTRKVADKSSNLEFYICHKNE